MTGVTSAVRVVLLAAVFVAGADSLRAQDLLPGVFVGTPDGPQELAVYAERSSGGRVKAPRASLDDLQRVSGAVRLICNLPNWRMRTVWLSTARVFSDESAERRTLQTVQRPLSVSAALVRVVPTEDSERWQRLLRDVGASADNPAYLFVTMESDGLVRDFMVAIDQPAATPR